MGELARAGDSAGAAAAGENAGSVAASASIAGAVSEALRMHLEWLIYAFSPQPDEESGVLHGQRL